MDLTENITKLNLGAGNCPIDGYVNLDITNGHLTYPLEWVDDSVDEIRASHLLEHFSHRRTLDVLRNWVSKLKPGGILKVAVPDFEKIAKSYIKGERINVVGYVVGGHVDKNDEHKNIFDRSTLTHYLQAVGLENVQEWESDVTDCASLPISLNLMGVKRNGHIAKPEQFTPEDNKIIGDILAKRRNIYSQYGEDGIVDAIFEKIGIKNKWCVEVGAGDGIQFSNTRRLIEDGWNAVLIEKEADTFARLSDNNTGNDKVMCVNHAVDTNDPTLDRILKQNGVPIDLDFMSIDIDGQDWHVWNSMLDYKPRVIMCEFAPNCDPNYVPVIGGKGQAGEQAIWSLGLSKDYHLATKTKVNWIFVHDSCLEKIIPNMKEKYFSSEDEAGHQDGKAHNLAAKTKISAIMSMPRLCFTDNMFSAVQAFLGLDIALDRGVGVFWGQCLTRMIEDHLDDGTEYLFTIDYDTWFRRQHVIRLCQLLAEHTEADAIIPIQTQRQGLMPMMGKRDENGNPITWASLTEFKRSLTPIATGHFGLTIFRASIFHKLPKPWFLAVPGPDGGWNEGRQDEDIYFWNNFAKAGFKAFLANDVYVGHLQLVSTFAGTPEENWKPQDIYMTDVEAGKVPAHCIPNVEMLKC